MTTEDITPQEHAALLQAYQNSNKRVDQMAPSRKQTLEGLATQLKAIQPNQFVNFGGVDAPAHEHLANVQGQLAKSLQYSDYPQFAVERGGINTTPVFTNLMNPSYSMATTVGRAVYHTDEQGNIHIKDTYNFPGKDPGTSLLQKVRKAWDNREMESLALGIPEAIGAHFSQDMPVDIQLTQGASRDWGSPRRKGQFSGR